MYQVSKSTVHGSIHFSTGLCTTPPTYAYAHPTSPLSLTHTNTDTQSGNSGALPNAKEVAEAILVVSGGSSTTQIHLTLHRPTVPVSHPPLYIQTAAQ